MQDEDTRFLSNLSAVLAHSVVYEARQQAPAGWDCFNGDPQPNHANEAGPIITDAFSAQLPDILKAIAQQYGVLDLAQVRSAGPVAQEQAGIIESLLPIASRIAQASNVYQDQAQPGLSNLRNTATDQLTRLLSSFGVDGLSPAENLAAERAVNSASASRGNIDKTSSIGTVQNALGFDDRRKENLSRLESAIQTAGSFIPASQAGQLNVGQMATGLTAPGSFAARAGESTNQLGSQWLSATTGLEQQYNQLNAQRESGLDKFNQTLSAVGDLLGGIGSAAALCWVAREVFGINDRRWETFRVWVLFMASDRFFWFYHRYGERIANWLHKHPRCKAPIRWWMNSKIKQIEIYGNRTT